MINIFIIVTILTMYFNNYRIYSQMKWRFELNKENKSREQKYRCMCKVIKMTCHVHRFYNTFII